MKYALIRVLPGAPPGGVCAGIDWVSTDHAVCVADVAGKVRDRFAVAHDRAGIATLIARLRKNGAGEVAIGRGDGGLADALRTGRARLRPLIRPACPSELAYSTGRVTLRSPHRKNVPPVKSPAMPSRASPDDSRTGSP